MRTNNTKSATEITGNGASETMGLSPESRIGRYHVEEKVGSGGFGDVYRATDPVLDRTVALKVIRRSKGEAANQLQDALAEARTASALNHPSIVTIYDVDEHNGEAFKSILASEEARTLGA